jgi:hypothetical protein
MLTVEKGKASREIVAASTPSRDPLTMNVVVDPGLRIRTAPFSTVTLPVTVAVPNGSKRHCVLAGTFRLA